MKASFFTESILYWFARGIAAASQRLPLPMVVGFGSGLGSAAYHLFGARRALALGNLKAALGDSYNHEEYEAILKKLFRHLGMTLMEVMQLPRLDEKYISRWITIPAGSRERLERARSKGNGVILLTAHFGNWELGGIISALAGYPMLVLAREQGWPKLNHLLVQYRESKGCKVVTKGFPIRELIEGLRQRRIVGILADQDGGRNGILNPFFGRLASTAPGAIALGLKTGAPILPVFIVRRHGAAHTLILEEPLAIPEEGFLEERVEKGIALYLKVLERYVRQYPHLWLWLHRRWKSSPQRRILLFSDGKSGHDAQAMALRQRLEAAWMKRLEDDKRLKHSLKGLLHTKKVQVEFRSPLRRLILTLVAALVRRRFPGGNSWLRWALTPQSYHPLQSSSADVGVSCGASTAAVNLLWSWGIRARAVHITRSRLPSWRQFDLSVIPRHDLPAAPSQGGRPSAAQAGLPRAKGGSLLLINGALAPLHPLEDRQLSVWRDRLGVSKEKRIGLLLGGPSRGIPFEKGEIEEIVQGLLKSAEALDAQLLVTSSRRTPPAVEEWLHKTLANHPRCRLLVLVNRQDSGNLESPSEAMPCVFGLSTHLVVSGDSVSMVSEAVASGHPVVSFLPKTNGFSFRVPKQIRFLEGLQGEGKVILAAPEEAGEVILKAVSDTSQPRETVSDTGGDPVVEFLTKWL